MSLSARREDGSFGCCVGFRLAKLTVDGSDRTITGLTSVPLHIQDCDLCLPLPLAIDDSLLTTAGAFPQPANTVPVLAGFHFNCRLYRLLGVILTAHRNMTASSLHPNDPYPMLNLPHMPMNIRPSRDFMEELERIIGDLPGPLRLVNPTSGTPGSSSNTDMPPPRTGRDSAAVPTEAMSRESGFATCRANIVVSQAMVRFAIRQYAKAIGEEDGASGGRQWAEKDVLQLLESMSSESLAANGESLVCSTWPRGSMLMSSGERSCLSRRVCWKSTLARQRGIHT